MSKNLTLKGAAFGALVALSIASVAPASAVVNDSAVSLVPTAGTQYSIVQDNVFDLKSDQSLAAVAGSGNLKFLVTDPSSKILFDYDGDTATNSDTLASAVSITDIAWTDGTSTTLDTVTLTTTETGIAVGDVISVSAVAGTVDGSAAIAAGVLSAINTSQVVSATASGTVSFKVPAATFAASVAASAATASAGTFTELSLTDGLDTRAVITNAAATLGVAGLTGLTAPTREANGSYVVDTGASAAATTDVLRLVSTAAAGTSATATVTAWIDENGNGTIENTEDSSSTRTVIFTPWASSGAALTLAQPIAGAANFGGTIGFNADINVAQITASRLTVGFGLVTSGAITDASNVTTVSSGAFTAGNLVQYNSTNNNFEAHVGGTAGVPSTDGSTTAVALAAGKTYAAQILVDGAVYGSVVYKSTSTAAADAVGYVGATKTENTKYNGTTGVTVRSGTKSVVVSAKVTKDSVAVANAPVTVSVVYSALHADSTVTVNGSSFTAASTTAAKTISYAATSAADGTVSVTIANSGAKANDAVTVTVVQAGISSTATTVTWSDVDHTATKLDEAANINNSLRNIAKGGSYTLNYVSADEFGAAPTTTWRILATYTFLGTSQTQVVKDIPVVGGKASLAITDASTANGTYNVVAKLQKLNASTGNYDDVDPDGGSSLTAISQTTTVHVGAASTAAAATLSIAETTAGTAGAINLEPKDFVAADLRVNLNQAAHGFTTTEKFTITGLITDASGIAIPGATVTLTSDAGALVAFLADGVVTVGSATVVADASGAYAVDAYSHKAGDVKFTATSGAATKTADAVQARNSAVAADIKNVVITAVDTLVPGYSAAVAVKVVDKWGNTVKDANTLTVTLTGPGYLTSYPTAASADGVASFTLVTPAGSIGTAAITVKAAAGSATTDDVTVTKSIAVGSAPLESAATITGATKKINLTIDNAKGEYVQIKVGNKTVKTFTAYSNAHAFGIKAAKGSQAVKVYVAGDLVAAKTVSVK